MDRAAPELSAAANPVEPADRLRRNRQPRRQLTEQHLALRTPLQRSRQGNIINHRPSRTPQQTDEIRFIRVTVPTESKLPPDMPDTLIIPLNQRIIFRANFKSIGSLVLITCFFVRQNRFGALIQTFSQKTAKNQISGRFPPLPSTRYVLDILLFTSA